MSMKLDKVVLYKILDIDFTLANVFMRTCSKINKFIKTNSDLMDKITHHYQVKIKNIIDDDLKLFFDCDYGEYNFKTGTISKPKPNATPIKNILIKQFNKKSSLYSKTTQIILCFASGKTFKNIHAKQLLEKIQIEEYQNLLWLIKKNCDLFRLSNNAHIVSSKYLLSQNKEEKIVEDIGFGDVGLGGLNLSNLLGGNNKIDLNFNKMELIDNVDALIHFIYTYQQNEEALKNNSNKLLVPIVFGFFITFVLGHWGRS